MTEWERADGIVARRVAGETVLIPAVVRGTDIQHRAAELYALNDTAARLWDALAAPSTAEDLARILITAFDVPEERARGDVASFLADMEAIGAIRRR